MAVEWDPARQRVRQRETLFKRRCHVRHSVHFKTEPKNYTENKSNRTDFMDFMVSGFGMV